MVYIYQDKCISINVRESNLWKVNEVIRYYQNQITMAYGKGASLSMAMAVMSLLLL